MSSISPITRERHGDRAWNKASGFGWASKERAVPVGMLEAVQLMMTLPLAFIRQGDQVLLIAVLGLRPGENLMVNAEGNWLGPSVPTAFQHYPFRQLRDDEGRDILGVYETALLPPDATGGTALFDSNGTPAAELATILAQLVQGDKERRQARNIAAVLDQHGLLISWELKVQGETEIQVVEGLYRVDEEKLNELPAEELHALRAPRALLMAYAQLLSMQHIHHLGQLTSARLRPPQQLATKGVTSNLIDDQGIISFANL
jgi:hypothetical protein